LKELGDFYSSEQRKRVEEVWSNFKINKDFSNKLIISFNVIAESLLHYKEEGLSFSFNGGKDCTVVLHLISIIFGDRISNIQTIYFEHDDTFEEEFDFIGRAKYEFRLTLIKTCKSYKEGLAQLLEENKQIKGIFLGTRKTDPHCSSLRFFSPTDSCWPKLMRINPILEWDYDEIWLYLKTMKVPYNKLYDFGYTSLGRKSNTQKNPALLNEETGKYHPAWMLKCLQSERNSRNCK